MFKPHTIPDRKFLEARRFLDSVNAILPLSFLTHCNISFKRKSKHRFHVTTRDKVWVLEHGIFYRRPDAEQPDLLFCDDLTTFAARYCGSAAKGLNELRQAYQDMPIFGDQVFSSQLAELCVQFLENKLEVENIIRRGQKRALINRPEDPGWYRVGITPSWKDEATPLKFASTVAALTLEELEVLGCNAQQLPKVKYRDGSFPVFYYCSTPAEVSEIHFPGYSGNSGEWFFRCGKASNTVPAFAPFCFCGLRLLAFVTAKDFKIYLREMDFLIESTLKTRNRTYSVLVGRGRSLEQVFSPFREERAHVFAGGGPVENAFRMASYFENMTLFGLDRGEAQQKPEQFNSIQHAIGFESFISDILMLSAMGAYKEPHHLEMFVRELAKLSLSKPRLKKIVRLANLDPENKAEVENLLSSLHGREASSVALDDKHSLAADPYTSTVVTSAGASHLVYNFRVWFETAFMYEEGSTPDYYKAFVRFRDKDEVQQEMHILVNKKAANSWRELAAAIKFECEKLGISFYPAAYDITFANPVGRHWQAMLDRAPLERGNTYLGFSASSSKEYQFPHAVTNPLTTDFCPWNPHPTDAALSHYTQAPPAGSIQQNLIQRPGFQMLLGYCASAAARFFLGQEIKPLAIRDSAEARHICGMFFRGFGQVGPMFIRQTDGAGVYKRIFSKLHGYPMWCIGPEKSIIRAIRGPVIVLDPEGNHELAPDPEISRESCSDAAFAFFTSWMAVFLGSPDSFISKFNPTHGCSWEEGLIFLHDVFPQLSLGDFNTEFPALAEILMDIPRESFADVWHLDTEGATFTPFTWSRSRQDVKKELYGRGYTAEFHGTTALRFKGEEADRFHALAMQFYS